ncbi:MAG: hypothetical protein ACRD6X_09375 [Pyrinomonadaceae bacterium]
MKKLIILGAVLLLGIGLFAGWGTVREVAGQIVEYFYADADMGPFENAKGGMSKEEFMALRADQIAMLRGVEKDKPFDPQLRIDGIRQMEGQEESLAQLSAAGKGLQKDRSVPRDLAALTAAWTEIGPNPIPNGQVPAGNPQLAVSGRTVGIAVHPTNPDIVYVGTAQGGLYRTTDGGTTWTPMLDSALSLAVNTVAIVPTQPDTIFAGTGEAGFSGDAFFGAGIYRIDNAGTASPIITGPIGGANFTGRAIGKIVVHPTDPNIIFASSTSGIGGIGGAANNMLAARGLFRSTDALSANPSFTKMIITGLAGQDRNILDVVIDPGNPNLVLCTEVDSFGLGEGGVYRSTDALAPAPTFVRTFTAGVGTGNSRTELALNRSGAGVVTVYAASALNGGTVHRSIDGGATFVQQIDNNFCTPQCFYDIAVEVDPTNADRVYLGGSPTLVFGTSTNGGTSFSIPVAAGLHVDSHAIAVAPSLPSTIYFGSDGGIYRSTDSGVTWTTLNNTTFRATQFIGLAIHPTDPNFTIGGTQDNGTNFYRPDATWFRADFGDGGYAVIDQNAVDTTTVRMYHTYFNAATLQGYGTVTTSAGATEGSWAFRGCSNVAGNGIPCGGAVLFYAPLEQGPGNPNTIYYGANILYRSADNGTNHTPASQNLVNPISAIGISPQDDNVRIVGQNNGGLFGTTTGSAALTNLDVGNTVPNNYIARAVIDPNNVNTAYVTLSAFGVTNVYRTADLNAANPTWMPLPGTGANVLPLVPVSAFIVDPQNSQRLYAGTDIGVFTSFNGGLSWFPFGTGLPRVAVFDIAITNAAPRQVRIATHGRGLWQHPAIVPTAANVRISGRVMTNSGFGVRNALITLTDDSGNVFSARSSTFGYYSFDSVAAGQSYVVNVSAKSYQFSPTVLSVTDDLTGFDLILSP